MQEENYWARLRRNRLSRRAFLGSSLVAGAGLATAAVVGCGDDEEGTTTGGSPTAAAGQPVRGGTIVGHVTNDGPHLDLHKGGSLFQSHYGVGVCYSRLFRKKLGKGGLPDAFVAEGDLVESYEQPEDNVYIFHLRKGVKYHNIPPVNGRVLVANDVIRSYERTIAEKVNAELLGGITKMTPTDDSTLRFELNGPNADFLLHLTDSRTPVIPHESWELSGDLTQGPIIGTGAWIFVEWVPNQIVRVRKNPEYFRSGLPYADAMDIRRIPDFATASGAFRTGQIHTLFQFSTKLIEDELRASVPDLVNFPAILPTALGGNKVWMHADKGPTQNIKVRQAISKAMDRNAVLQLIEFGRGILYAGVGVPELDWFLPEEEIRKLLAPDVPGAKKLAAEANFTGWEPTFFAGVKQFPTVIPTAELIQAQLKVLNINATIVPIDNIQLLNNAWGQGEWDMGFGTQQPQPSPTLTLERFYKTGGSQNTGYKLSDKELDDLIAKQKGMVDDPDGRKKVFQDIQRRVIELAVVTPVYSGPGAVIVSPKYKGFVNTGAAENSVAETSWVIP